MLFLHVHCKHVLDRHLFLLIFFVSLFTCIHEIQCMFVFSLDFCQLYLLKTCVFLHTIHVILSFICISNPLPTWFLSYSSSCLERSYQSELCMFLLFFLVCNFGIPKIHILAHYTVSVLFLLFISFLLLLSFFFSYLHVFIIFSFLKLSAFLWYKSIWIIFCYH